MHVVVFFIAGFVLIAGLVMASELQGTQSTILGVQTLIVAALIATFGRIEQHLGSLVDLVRQRNTPASGNALAASTGAQTDDVLVLSEDCSVNRPIAEGEGEILGRKYRAFSDGSVEVKTLLGPKRFPSIEAAKAYIV